MRKKYILLVLLAFAIILLILMVTCSSKNSARPSRFTSEEQIEESQEDNNEGSSIEYVGLPQPSSDNTGIILRRMAYTASYNPATRCPNWVAWRLTAEHADGDVPRINQYLEDTDVPAPRATNEDYKGSGWSHGHMCPAGDNKWSEQAMRESNLMTNICPQNRSMNSGVWNSIENDCRKWARKFGDVYIVCGPLYLNREHEKIGADSVFVPEAFFKVILCLQGTPKGIGYVVRNNEGTKKKDLFVNTIDDVERITGYDFFPALPDDIEERVESYSNIEDWK